MVWFSKIMLGMLIAFTLLLQGCQSSFVIDQTNHFAQKFGIIHPFEITRWHHRVLSTNNHISVVSDAVNNVDVIFLSEVIAKGLSPYFNHVQGGASRGALSDAIALTKVHGNNFLLYVEVVEANAVIEPKSVEPTTNYSRMKLTLTVVDIGSDAAVEKIVVTAETPHLNFWGNEIPDLLVKPIAYIGKSLTGTPADS